MKNSPWAKLIRRATPEHQRQPRRHHRVHGPQGQAVHELLENVLDQVRITWGPRDGPQAPGAARDAPAEPGRPSYPACRSIQERRARGDFLQNLELAVAHLDQDHVDPGLVVLVELDRAQRRVLDVDLFERGRGSTGDRPCRSSSCAISMRRHHRPLERDGRQAAVDARRDLVALRSTSCPTRGRARSSSSWPRSRRRRSWGCPAPGRGTRRCPGCRARTRFCVSPSSRYWRMNGAPSLARMTREDRLGVGALEPGQHRPVVGLAGIEELGGDQLDAGLLERRRRRRWRRRGRSRCSWPGSTSGLHPLLGHVAGEGVGHDLVVERHAGRSTRCRPCR